MHHPLPDFRNLYDCILEYEGASLLLETILPWYDVHGDLVRSWFLSLATRVADPEVAAPIPAVSQPELWELYAFSRVNQVLLLAFQPAAHRTLVSEPGWAPDITQDDYRSFVHLNGMDKVTAAPFSPFFHEIVSVEQSPDDDSPPVVLRELWPAVMLGDLMISRAGVAVSAGRSHIREEIAEASTLYWEFWRRSRPANDLSHGWGSNSQWRTNFRRDYLIDGCFHFNVDGDADTAGPPWYQIQFLGMKPEPGEVPATEAERVEVLTHRCFVVTDKPHQDLHPFDDTCRIPVPKGLESIRDDGTL